MATHSNLEWRCVDCTFKNKAENVFCEICYAAKGVPASQSVAIDDRTKQQSQYTNNKISKPSSGPTKQNTSNRFPFNKQKKNSNTRNHQKKIEIRMCNDYGTVNTNGCKFGQLNKDPSKDCLNIHIENRYDINNQNNKNPLVNIIGLTESKTMELADKWYKNKNINIRNLGIYLHEAVKGYNDAEFSGSFVRTSPKNDKNNDDEKKQSNSIDEISQKMGYVKFGVYSRMFHECVCNYLMGKIPKHREKQFSQLWQKEDYVESIIKQTNNWQSKTNGKNAMSICDKLEYIRKKTNHIVHGCVKYGEKACTRYLEYNQQIQILVYLHDIAKWLNDDIIKQKYTPKPLDDQKQNMTNNNDANRPYRNNSGGSIRGQGRSASHDNNNNYNREINNRNINKKQQKLKRWLKDTVSLEQYFDVLVDNGFDKMESMKMLTMNELNLLGIIEHEHRIRLLKCIDALKK